MDLEFSVELLLTAVGQSMVRNGMEWKMEWNGAEISEWNMENARMEWNGRFQGWNGRQSSILP